MKDVCMVEYSNHSKVERVHDSRTLIVKNLFKKETKQSLFTGMEVRHCYEHLLPLSNNTHLYELVFLRILVNGQFPGIRSAILMSLRSASHLDQ